jgi:phosphatidylglycerol:prolipoprotein diacylglycerol transferase
MVAPGVMLGQVIGRWGNFINGEAHGIETAEDFFLRMGLMGAADTTNSHRMIFYHPTFLYESLWNLLGFVLINIFYRKKKYDGQILLAYLAWYGFGRMFIEGLRTDSLYIGVFRVSQVVGFLCFVICGVLLLYFQFRSKRKQKDAEEYVSQYDHLRGPSLKRAERTDAQTEQAQEPTEEDIFDRAPTKEE